MLANLMPDEVCGATDIFDSGRITTEPSEMDFARLTHFGTERHAAF